MPDHNTDGIDVSAEERRFLRRTFHRLAAPYLLGALAIVWMMMQFGASEESATGVDPEAMTALEERLQTLETTLENLGERLDVVGHQTTTADERVAALEESTKKSGASNRDWASIQGEVRRASDRVKKLEKAVEKTAATQRIDALSQRMQRVEEQSAAALAAARRVAEAAPAPAPPVPVPAAPPEPVPGSAAPASRP